MGARPSRAQEKTPSVPEDRNLEEFNFDNQHKVQEMFTENAKTYIQLSSAALLLCSKFLQEVLGFGVGKPSPPPDIWLKLTWGAFLLTIVAGAFYQYLAVKYLEIRAKHCSFHLWDWLARRCGWVYGLMLSSFYSGAGLFVYMALQRLNESAAK
jgi:hypothetical protein